MKIKRVSEFFKNYGFYLAMGVISIGALVSIFTMPNRAKQSQEQPNPYAQHETAEGEDLLEANRKESTVVDEDELDTTDENQEQAALDEEDQIIEEDQIMEEDQLEDEISKPEETTAVNNEPQVSPETFESTTASISNEPFFAEGDTLAWPVEGSVIVPYTDEHTSSWYSATLNQTMRTQGICIGAEKATEVKAVAKGTVTEIIDDSSTYLEAGMPYVGKLMIVDLGNGYTVIYGFQGGTVKEELVGQVVNVGDVLGTIGSPTGAFIEEGDNIYLQVTHNEKVMNPLNLLQAPEDDTKTNGVDMGFDE